MTMEVFKCLIGKKMGGGEKNMLARLIRNGSLVPNKLFVVERRH